MGRTWTYGSPVDNDIKKDGKWWATALSKSEALKIVDQLAAYEARIADLEAEIKIWQANDHNQTKAIDLLRKDAERIDDLEKDFAEIQHIMGCNHEDMHRCVSTMEQEFAETKAELARVKAESLRECQILAHATARLWAGDTE